MWHCPDCIKPQTLLDQALQHQGYWQQSYFVPYTQAYRHTAIAFRGLEVGLFFHGGRCRITLVDLRRIQASELECTCGAKMAVPDINIGTIFFSMTQFFKKILKPLPAPKITSIDTFVEFTETQRALGRESLVRSFVLRKIRHSYLDKRGAQQWLLWYKP